MVQSIALITQEVCGQEGGRVGHKVLLCFVLEVSDLISAPGVGISCVVRSGSIILCCGLIG